MRRSTVFRLVGVVLVIGIGAYSAYWWVAAAKIKKAALAWQEAERTQKVDVTWQTLRVAGYPLSFRLEASNFSLKDGASNPPIELSAPSLSASLKPWNFRNFWFSAADGLGVALGSAAAPLAKLEAQHGSGAVALGNDGGANIWLSLYQPKGTAIATLGARALNAWVTLPGGAPAAHLDTGLAFALEVKDLGLPAPPPGLNPKIDDIGFGVTLMGEFPSGPLRPAAQQWRESGGTIELDHLDLRWGDMEINGTGTLALDSDLQPIGGFSGGVSGFDQLLNALVAAGRVKASDARIARLALAMLAKTGPDGRPEIAASFTIQNGEMYLGPAKLGPAPRIDW
ncbi:MAG: DUF2125 domain-containing protein [Stellaceae bacterium]